MPERAGVAAAPSFGMSFGMKQDGKKVLRVGIYLRVSTDGQTTLNQRHDFEEAAAGANWKVVKV